ncbi:3-hydroxy-5-phosphonooxypentane-2,4-dione thiolase LsrF, partial [bacterium]|nr:3-hydroxy-5-phosphonooxypentane-2,4-dione thiolase LsrF [bacterium]
MPDADVSAKKVEKDFGVGIPVQTPGEFFLKGAGSLGWGMQNRLSRIFNPETGKAVMLAFDHGYIMGPTSGIERMDLSIPPLIPHVDCLMCTRGAIAQVISPTCTKPVVLRCSTGATILKELSDEVIGVTIEDAIRLNAAAITAQVYIGGPGEKVSLTNLSYL